jgi:hypothetical protein
MIFAAGLGFIPDLVQSAAIIIRLAEICVTRKLAI